MTCRYIFRQHILNFNPRMQMRLKIVLNSASQPIEIWESCVSMCVTTYECVMHSISFTCILTMYLLTVLSASHVTYEFCTIYSAVLLYTHGKENRRIQLFIYRCCCVCESYTRYYVHAHFFLHSEFFHSCCHVMYKKNHQ